MPYLILETRDLTPERLSRFAEATLRRHPEVVEVRATGSQVALRLRGSSLRVRGVDGIPLIVWAIIGLAAIAGIAVVAWQIREAIPEIPEWVPYVVGFGGLVVLALAIAWVAGS